jgi:hypothetical protein
MYIQLCKYKVFLQEHFSDFAVLSGRSPCAPVNSVVKKPCTIEVTEEHNDDESGRAF